MSARIPDAVAASYQAGATLAECAAVYGCSIAGVARALERLGIERRQIGQRPGRKSRRVALQARVTPETHAAIVAARRRGERIGQTVDRLIGGDAAQ